jgi:hypothetical protein
MKALKYCQTAIWKTAREHTFSGFRDNAWVLLAFCGTDDDVESFATESLLELRKWGNFAPALFLGSYLLFSKALIY